MELYSHIDQEYDADPSDSVEALQNLQTLPPRQLLMKSRAGAGTVMGGHRPGDAHKRKIRT